MFPLLTVDHPGRVGRVTFHESSRPSLRRHGRHTKDHGGGLVLRVLRQWSTHRPRVVHPRPSAHPATTATDIGTGRSDLRVVVRDQCDTVVNVHLYFSEDRTVSEAALHVE